jgi:hypothetical protein
MVPPVFGPILPKFQARPYGHKIMSQAWFNFEYFVDVLVGFLSFAMSKEWQGDGRDVSLAKL